MAAGGVCQGVARGGLDVIVVHNRRRARCDAEVDCCV